MPRIRNVGEVRPQPFFVCASCLKRVSERSERAQSCSCSIEISDMYVYTYIYVYIYMCMWSYVKLYAHARWYVMWEGLSVNHFLKHSSHFK